jgi:hypothetical protein
MLLMASPVTAIFLSSSLKAIICVMINRLGDDVFGLLGIFDDEERSVVEPQPKNSEYLPQRRKDRKGRSMILQSAGKIVYLPFPT